MTLDVDALDHVLEFDPGSHTYWIDKKAVPSVTQLLEDIGLVPDYTVVRPEVLARARGRGIHVDACADLYDEDDLDFSSVHPEAVPYLDAWIRFRAETGYEPVAGQVPLWHPELNYCGTADSIGRLRGRWVAVERKATAKMAETYRLQTQGYALPGLWAAPRGGGRLAPVPWPTPARLGVHLLRDATYRVHVYDDAEDLEAFRAVVALARWRALRRDALRGNGRLG